MARLYIEGRNKEADCTRIVGWINKWRKRLHLTEWTVYIDLKPKSNKDRDRLADIATDNRYYKATITIYPCFWQIPVKEQERSLVHELIHMPLHRMNVFANKLIQHQLLDSEQLDDAHENVTEWLANVIWDSYEK